MLMVIFKILIYGSQEEYLRITFTKELIFYFLIFTSSLLLGSLVSPFQGLPADFWRQGFKKNLITP